MLDIISYMKLFKASMLVNIFFILVICYLAYHLVYGKFNIQNYLVYKFEEKIWKQIFRKRRSKKINLNLFDEVFR